MHFFPFNCDIYFPFDTLNAAYAALFLYAALIIPRKTKLDPEMLENTIGRCIINTYKTNNRVGYSWPA